MTITTGIELLDTHTVALLQSAILLRAGAETIQRYSVVTSTRYQLVKQHVGIIAVH